MVRGVENDAWDGNDMKDEETYELKQVKIIQWIGDDGEEHRIECTSAYTAGQCREVMMWNKEWYPFDRMKLHDGIIWEIHSGEETMCWVKRNARIYISNDGLREVWTVVKGW